MNRDDKRKYADEMHHLTMELTVNSSFLGGDDHDTKHDDEEKATNTCLFYISLSLPISLQARFAGSFASFHHPVTALFVLQRVCQITSSFSICLPLSTFFQPVFRT